MIHNQNIIAQSAGDSQNHCVRLFGLFDFNTMEVWKDIKGYEGLYQVSNLGRIKSLRRERGGKLGGIIKERILNPGKNNRGYLYVNLYSRNSDGSKINRTVHQLVAKAFLNHNPCGLKLVVNHIDFNPLNNCVSNIEIVTNRENCNKKHIKSTSKYVGVHWHKINKRWHAKIKINGRTKHLGSYYSEIDASNAYQKESKMLVFLTL